MGLIVTNSWGLFRYGVKRYHYGKLIGIREFTEQPALDSLNNPFSEHTPHNEVDEGETVSTCRALYFSISIFPSAAASTISDININSAS